MLRIPLPEYDGFALREACKGLHVFRGRAVIVGR